MGIGVGMILPLYMSIPNVMLTQALYATVFLTIYAIAAESSHTPTANSVGFLDSWRIVAGDLSLCRTVVCSSVIMGVAYTALGLFGSIFYRRGYAHEFITWLGLGFVGAAMIGAILASVWERWHKNISVPLKIMVGLSVVSLASWAVFFNQPEICVVFCVMTGACMIGSIPLQLEISVRRSKAIPEFVPANIIYFCAEFCSILFTLGFVNVEAYLAESGMWMLAVIIFLVSIVVIIKESDSKNENETELPLM